MVSEKLNFRQRFGFLLCGRSLLFIILCFPSRVFNDLCDCLVEFEKLEVQLSGLFKIHSRAFCQSTTVSLQGRIDSVSLLSTSKVVAWTNFPVQSVSGLGLAFGEQDYDLNEMADSTKVKFGIL